MQGWTTCHCLGPSSKRLHFPTLNPQRELAQSKLFLGIKKQVSKSIHRTQPTSLTLSSPPSSYMLSFTFSLCISPPPLSSDSCPHPCACTHTPLCLPVCAPIFLPGGLASLQPTSSRKPALRACLFNHSHCDSSGALLGPAIY